MPIVQLAASITAAALLQSVPLALTVKDLQHFTYDLGPNANVEGGKVPLAGGKWTDQESGSSFALHPTHAIGDLNGDGAADAVAVLVENSGGTGSFYYLFALATRSGKLEQLGEPEWLGDRTVIQRLGIDRKGIITVNYVTHAPGDASCCPTMKIEDRYRVENGRLIGITK